MSRAARAVGIAAALVLLALAVAAGVGYARRIAFAEQWLHAQIAARGIAPAALRVTHVDARGIAVADLTVGAPGAPDLVIDAIDASWSPGGLYAGRLDALRVRGVRLRGAMRDERLSFGALDPLLTTDESPDAAPMLPASEISVEDGRVQIETREGVANGTLGGSLASAGDGAIDGDFALALEGAGLAAHGTLAVSGTLDAPAFEALLDASEGLPISGHLEARGRIAEVDGKRGVEGNVVLRDARARIATAQGVARGSADGAVALAAGGAIDGSFQVSLDAAGLRGRGTLALTGAMGAPAFHALLDSEPGTPLAGRVEVRGRITEQDGTRGFDATVALRDASYDSKMLRASGINGVIAVQGMPLHTPKQQVLSLAKVDLGLPLTDGLVEFALRRDGTVAIANATLHLANGELRAQDVVLDMRAAQTEVTLQAHGLDLTELLANVDLPGIEGTGLVNGNLPLTRKGSTLIVTGGKLHAAESGGTIKYTPSEKTRALGDARPGDLGIALEALSNFHYQILEARLDGELQGEMKIGLHVRGENPDFHDGRPVELNLNLEARLADLVRDGAAAYRVPAAIEERLRAFSEGSGK